MKKIFPLAVLLILSANETNAQIRFGGEKSITLNNLSSNGLGGDYQMKVGFRTGFLADIPVVGNLSVQPGIGYTMKGAEMQSTAGDGNTRISNKTKLALDYIELPVNIVYNFGDRGAKHFFAGAGAYVSRLFSGRIKQRTETVVEGGDTKTTKEINGLILGNADNSMPITRVDFGANILAGYQFGNKTYVKAGGTFGFNDLNTEGSIPFDGRNVNISLTLGRYIGCNCR